MSGETLRLTDRKRQAIVEAAIEEFREKGFTGARTTAIAKRANVSSRTLYRHFESKESLFVAIADLTFAEAANVPTYTFDNTKPLRQQLLHAATSYINHITTADMIDLARTTMGELMRDHVLAQNAFGQITLQEDPIKLMISQAMEAGALRSDDAHIAAHQLTSMIKALLHAPLMYTGSPMPLSKDRNDLIEDCVDMFLRYYQPV